MKLKPVVFLMGLHFASPVHAIGLGDLTVHSGLGQPLHATIKVLSAPPTLDADCLSLRPSDNGLPTPAQARFRVEHSGEHALLHITTPRSIDDPVAQFVLASDCEGHLQREYVLLLDPPTPIEPARLATPQVALSPTVADLSPVSLDPSSGQALTPASTKPRAVRAQPRRAASPRPMASTTPSASTTAAPADAAAPRASLAQSERATTSPRLKSDTTMPRLVISGKRDTSATGSLPAGAEKENTPADQSTQARPTKLTPTELSDENTALSHRLAYLEAQIAALHKRNAELESRPTAPAQAVPQATVAQVSQWPLYLIGGGLFTLSTVLVAGIGRRRLLRQEKTATLPMAELMTAISGKAHTRPPLPQLDDMFQNDSPERSLSAREKQGIEIKEDIVNQAEVFVAHGQTHMAINLLQEHLHEAPAGSPVPWLLLLDLLLQQGDKAGYAEASTGCRRHFNVSFPAHPWSQDQQVLRGLENYPHILDMLTQAWTTPEINGIFKSLIYDQRNGVRMGFDPGAYRDILLLNSIALEKEPIATTT